MKKVAVIGGGAAGFFAAIRVKECHPSYEVTILEKSSKVLAKVKVSGGGRCNVTNGETSIKNLVAAYPRGGKLLKKLFTRFSTAETQQWFTDRGVPLVTQEDNCVFPVSQDSQSIIDCFMAEVNRLHIDVQTGSGVKAIQPLEDNIVLQINDNHTEAFDYVIVTTGGSPRRKGLEWLEVLGHQIEDPVPSLYTFNMPQEPIRDLMGIVVEETMTSIEGTKLRGDGPLLITHWGMSGPAILKLSAFGARILNDKDYQFKVKIHWSNTLDFDQVRSAVQAATEKNKNRQIGNVRLYGISERLWAYLLEKNAIDSTKRASELSKKEQNKLINTLCNDEYQVSGKTTFKEEFVTCGGISLDSIEHRTMKSKSCPNLYFAGEVLDIDGITGGYNFQAAWTTAWVAGELG